MSRVPASRENSVDPLDGIAPSGPKMHFPPLGAAAVGFLWGWSGWLQRPGTPQMDCRVCAARCEVLRNVIAHGNVENLFAGRKEPHDFFFCPWIARRWHIRLARAVSGQRRSPIS